MDGCIGKHTCQETYVTVRRKRHGCHGHPRPCQPARPRRGSGSKIMERASASSPAVRGPREEKERGAGCLEVWKEKLHLIASLLGAMFHLLCRTSRPPKNSGFFAVASGLSPIRGLISLVRPVHLSLYNTEKPTSAHEEKRGGRRLAGESTQFSLSLKHPGNSPGARQRGPDKRTAEDLFFQFSQYLEQLLVSHDREKFPADNKRTVKIIDLFTGRRGRYTAHTS
jgi:hypothetical protein